jgi:4-amino-4-deoxy-L-arabinose transferase-like glycosyltransferase
MHARNSAAAGTNVWFVALAAIALLSFGLRWHYVSATFVRTPLGGDASQYFLYAWNLAHHGVFSLSRPEASAIIPDSYRDPGYPLFLAIWMKATGDGPSWYVAVLMCQALLGTLTIALSLQVSKQWLSARWATAAGLLMAVWPHNIAINGFLLTETLLGFLCALGMLLWTRACRDNHRGLAFASGLVLGLAALTNAVLKPFGVLLAVFLAWRKPPLRKACLILALASLALPAAWSIRNAQLPSPDIHNSSKARALQNFVQGSWPAYHPMWRLSKFGDDTARANAKVILEAMDNEYGLLLVSPAKGLEAIGRRMSQHPLAYAGWYLFKKPYELWGWDIEIGQGDIYPYPVANSPFQTNQAWRMLAALADAINPFLLVLASACFPLSWWSYRHVAPLSHSVLKERPPLLTILVLLAYVTSIYTLLQAEPRYSIPFRAFEIALAFTSLATLANCWKAYRERSSAYGKLDT